MKKYGKSCPKGMIKVNGKTLIERQIQVLNNVGIKKIIIVTGYKFKMINYNGIIYYHNENYQKTNMVESLMCAKAEFDQDIIVTYADLIYTEELINKLIESNNLVSVCVDSDWKNYWIYRYNQIETDLESLLICNGVITELGAARKYSEGIDYRFVGIVKFSIKIIPNILSIYKKKKVLRDNWIQSGKDFFNGYMTDFLYEIILNDISVNPVIANRNWLEIDTPTDYESLLRDYNTGKIGKYFSGSLG